MLFSCSPDRGQERVGRRTVLRCWAGSWAVGVYGIPTNRDISRFCVVALEGWFSARFWPQNFTLWRLNHPIQRLLLKVFYILLDRHRFPLAARQVCFDCVDGLGAAVEDRAKMDRSKESPIVERSNWLTDLTQTGRQASNST